MTEDAAAAKATGPLLLSAPNGCKLEDLAAFQGSQPETFKHHDVIAARSGTISMHVILSDAPALDALGRSNETLVIANERDAHTRKDAQRQ